MKKDIFIFSDGALKREQNTLKFFSEDKRRFLPVEDIKAIYAFGEIDINKKLLELLSQKEIMLHYFNYYGYYMGSFYPREHMNSGYMILKQAEFYNDSEKRFEVAKAFVYGSLRNIRQVIAYYRSRGKDLEHEVMQFDEHIKDIGDIEDIPELMAFEGNAREMYYRLFDKIIDNPDFVFEKRTRRPPKNHLNALISFGNTLMYTSILGEIYKTHLDPRIGYLHSTNFRRFSLNLDVAEIFKPIIVDRIIFSLISKKEIGKKDFVEDMEGLVLKDSARKKFVEAFDSRMKQTIKIDALSRKVSYRRLMRMELYKLEKHFMGEKAYSPYVSKW